MNSTDVFMDWLEAHESECAKALIVVEMTPDNLGRRRYKQLLLTAIWERQRSAPVLRLLIYALFAIDFKFVFEHLYEQPRPKRPQGIDRKSSRDFVKSFVRDPENLAFIATATSAETEFVVDIEPPDPVAELLRSLLAIAIGEVNDYLSKRRRRATSSGV